MTPRNNITLHIVEPKMFMSHNYHMATCPAAAAHRGKVILNSFGLAPGLLHSNVKLHQTVISCSPEASW